MKKDSGDEILWHTKTKETIFEELEASDDGLTTENADLRLQVQGLNEIKQKKKESVLLEVLKKFNSPLVYILIVAMVISFIFDHQVDGYVILFIIFVNVTISFVQERKAERAIDALKKMIISYAKVYRDKELKKIPARELVPGDIILLENQKLFLPMIISLRLLML